MPQAKRTLVKSVPELWAELADAEALAGHLGPFGDVRITRATPEKLVEWEGDHATGTVRLEPSGWGTRVVLTSEAPEPRPSQRRSLVARLLRRAAAEPEPPALDAEAVLDACLDTLGSARHRPFSRL